MRLQRVHLPLKCSFKIVVLLLEIGPKDGLIFTGRSDGRVEIVVGNLVLLLPRCDVIGGRLDLVSFV